MHVELPGPVEGVRLIEHRVWPGVTLSGIFMGLQGNLWMDADGARYVVLYDFTVTGSQQPECVVPGTPGATTYVRTDRCDARAGDARARVRGGAQGRGD